MLVLLIIYSLITGQIVKCDRPFCFTVSINDLRPKDCMTFKSSGGDSCRFSGIFDMTEVARKSTFSSKEKGFVAHHVIPINVWEHSNLTLRANDHHAMLMKTIQLTVC